MSICMQQFSNSDVQEAYALQIEKYYKTAGIRDKLKCLSQTQRNFLQNFISSVRSHCVLPKEANVYNREITPILNDPHPENTRGENLTLWFQKQKSNLFCCSKYISSDDLFNEMQEFTLARVQKEYYQSQRD